MFTADTLYYMSTEPAATAGAHRTGNITSGVITIARARTQLIEGEKERERDREAEKRVRGKREARRGRQGGR